MILEKKFVFVFLLSIFCASFAQVISPLDERLIDTYGFDYGEENLQLINSFDYMEDTDKNGINDTLFFNLSINSSKKMNCSIYLDLEDSERIFSSSSKGIIYPNYNNFLLNLSTIFLSSKNFSYSIKIYDEKNFLIFRKMNLQTKNYLEYEQSFKISDIYEENLKNDSIRIHLTTDSSKDLTKKFTLFMDYENRSLTSQKDLVLSKGKNEIYFDFEDEFIANTHYKGKYFIKKLIFEDKTLNLNYSTETYNFEFFTKRPYIQKVEKNEMDLDADGLIDCLKINFTIQKNSFEKYGVKYLLYDSSNKLIASVSKKELLQNSGVINTFIKGDLIYKKKSNPPYTLREIKLTNSSENLIDSLPELFFETNQSSYLDFERPPLPDLKIINLSKENETNILQIANLGDAPAFNLFLRGVTNNFSYQEKSLFLLKENQIYNFNFSNDLLFSAFFIDPQDIIEESNEENNYLYLN